RGGWHRQARAARSTASPPADSVTATTQTRKTSVKLSLAPGRDSAQTRGSFRMPAGMVLDADTQPVMLRLTEGTGTSYYDGTIPPESFRASGTRRRFKFSDPTLATPASAPPSSPSPVAV